MILAKELLRLQDEQIEKAIQLADSIQTPGVTDPAD